MHVVEELMSLSKFIYYEFLKWNHVDDIKQCLDLVNDHYAILISNAAVAEVSHYYQHGFDNLSSNNSVDESWQIDIFMRWNWGSSIA